MDQRANYLSLILLDALEDENESDILYILQNNKYVDAAYVPQERGIAPLHYVCGMENGHIAKEMAKRFMEMGANPNVCSDDNMTPLHVAAMYGRVEIVKLLLEYGADLDVYDDDRKTPLLYAIDECHFEVVQLIRDHIYFKKCLKKKQQHLNSLHNTTSSKDVHNGLINKNITNSNITNREAREGENDDNLTPKRLQYNYDMMSPYYINITHRRHKPQPCFPDNNEQLPPDKQATATQKLMHATESVDIFTLTKENLEELTRTRSEEETSKISFIKLWQEKVQKSRTRQSILKQYDNINEMIDEIVENDHINFTNIEFNEKTQEKVKCVSPMPTPIPHDSIRSVYKTPMSINKIVQQISEAKIIDGEKKSPNKANLSNSMIESSYITVPEYVLEMDQQGIERDKHNEYFLQMTEAYVHTDDENGLVFYETKLLTNKALKGTQQRSETNGNLKIPIKCPSTGRDSMHSTRQSDNLTLPSDYETDALRAELTMFGQPPGPITSTTKRLYIKKLIKCKRKLNSVQALEEKLSSTANQFSVELQRTVKSVEHFDGIKDYMKFDTQSTEYFANNNNSNNLKKPLREGHLKQSFIYMLIDPRISCNLPGESVFLDKFDIWKRFLQAIFYVGKGKTSRPYSHLYDALKLHTRTNYEELHKKSSSKPLNKVKKPPFHVDGGKTSQKSLLKSKKLDRILEIWDNGNGVVCLHVFHNIIPIEAYTREAAIIEALSLKHLTNCKRGDYYGPAKTWTMKEKKYLGIALLYKAMNIYLAEGESQLSPCDLI